MNKDDRGDKDLYSILEINSDADTVKIKAAYRKLVRKYHPDVSSDAVSIEKFKQIQTAYEILSNALKKRQYDISKGYYRGSSPKSQQSQAQRAYSEVQKPSQKTSSGSAKTSKEAQKTPRETAQKATRETVYGGHSQGEKFSKVFNDILGDILHKGSQKQAKSEKRPAKNGEDMTTNLSISLKEAINGTHRTVNILHTEICPNCQGRKFINEAKCPLCKGIGEVSIHKKINVKIPAGIKKGSKIRIAGEGNKGGHGGQDGDLYLIIDIEEKSFLKQDGVNLNLEVPITPFEAVLGADIEIPTLDGKITMKIPPKTISGQKFRLSNQGLPNKKTDKKGDLVVTVKIEIPTDLSDKEIELYKELQKASVQDIRRGLND